MGLCGEGSEFGGGSEAGILKPAAKVHVSMDLHKLRIDSQGVLRACWEEWVIRRCLQSIEH